jgi:hypothetical protein
VPSPRIFATASVVLSYKIDNGTPPKKAKVSIGTEPGPRIGVQSGPLSRHEGGSAGELVAEP